MAKERVSMKPRGVAKLWRSGEGIVGGGVREFGHDPCGQSRGAAICGLRLSRLAATTKSDRNIIEK